MNAEWKQKSHRDDKLSRLKDKRVRRAGGTTLFVRLYK